MTQHEIEQEPEDRESGLIRRTFAAELSEGDGRTVDVRIVPYGEQIEHNDGLGGARKGVVYREEFVMGAFAHQTNAAFRVLVNVEHQEGIGGVVGHGKSLLERDDGLYGSFKIHENSDGDKTLMLVREGILDGVSLEAQPTKSIRSAAGVIKRVKANLYNVALTRYRAYQGAVVLALREEMLLDEELLPVPMDPELIERCRALGIRLPERLAHPADTGTPLDSGTPEDGTRPKVQSTSSSEV